MTLPNIAVHGSHNASFAIEHNGDILEVLELERFLNIKNAGYTDWGIPFSNKSISKLVLAYFKDKYGFDKYDTCHYQNSIEHIQEIPANRYIEGHHHVAHAAGTFYQSPFDNALVISFDGGSKDGWFQIFKANRQSGMTLLKNHLVDLGTSYMWFGFYLNDIKFEEEFGALIYPGKILGLQSYGTPKKEWISHFKNFFTSQNRIVEFEKLGKIIGVTFDLKNRLVGQVAYDVAATAQAAFEELTFELITETILDYPNLPICLTGGCALNIVLNTKIKERFGREVFVAPNMSDCGLTFGMLANHTKPQNQLDATYIGPEPFDKHFLLRYIENRKGREVDAKFIAKELMEGKIIGVVQGRAEHGPRALGNRSILCNPTIKNMKDKLNQKVKRREWYRPFAPIVKLEDVSEYFDWDGESRWMAFCVNVKEQYRKIISAVVHVDNTARVQTITESQNKFIYDVLTEFKKFTGVGVLVNTSFNVDGKPILSTYEDAFKVLDETQLDAIYLDGFYFTK